MKSGPEKLLVSTLGTRVLRALLSLSFLLPACTGRESLGSNFGKGADAGTAADVGTVSDVGTAADTGRIAEAGKAADLGMAGADATAAPVSPSIPRPAGSCPAMAGLAGTNLTFSGSAVTIWSGPAGSVGPMVFYWHATNADSDEAVQGLGPGTSEVVTSGGVIASFVASNRSGSNTGDSTWYTGDFDTADQVLACASQQGLIDVTHIHSAGYSPGSCQTAAMVYARAYLASVLCYSGGAKTVGSLPDPTNHPAIIGAHGGVGNDIFGIDIAVNTMLLENDLKSKGSFVIDCDDGGDHIQSIGARMSGVAAPAWQFLKDHPYRVDPEPYQDLPGSFPTYCKAM